MAELPPGRPADERHLPRTPSSEFTFQRFGRQTYLRTSRPTLGATVVEILPNNPDRLFWEITNRSANTLSIGWDAEITAGIGVLIAPTGGAYSAAIEEDGDVVAWGVYGVASGANSQLYVIEILGRP